MKSYFVKFAACLNKEDTAAARLKSKHESQQWAGFIVNTKNQNGQGNLSISPAAAPSSVYFLPRKVWKVLHHKFCCCGSGGCVHCVESAGPLTFTKLVFSEEYPNELFGCNLRKFVDRLQLFSHLKMDLTTPQLTGVAQWFSNAYKPKKSKKNREVSILILICVE